MPHGRLSYWTTADLLEILRKIWPSANDGKEHETVRIEENAACLIMHFSGLFPVLGYVNS